MVKKRLIAGGALLCACAMLMNGWSAAAEEKRLGDYIYVPAMQVEASAGAISLRVEGASLAEEGEQSIVVDHLAGAEFGVYVVKADGELSPWANPLFPSEQMRIRTGEGETRFSLPSGPQYYLRQESAPQGYLFDAQKLIPVEGEEIVVHNAMAGQLAVSAVDTMGNPIPGVQVHAVYEDGETMSAYTGEDGQAVFLCDRGGIVSVCEAALPDGVFAARSVSASMPEGDAVQTENGLVQRVVSALASRSSVVFSHPAAGSVELNMSLAVIDDNAQVVSVPLAGVSMEILSQTPVTIVTDAQGRASCSLLEGTYDVRLAYDGEESVVMPLSEGQMIVSSGSTTLIELSAVQTQGRVLVLAQTGRPVSGGSVTLCDVKSGKTFGPYLLDAEGLAVSDMLPEGSYRISDFTAPDGTQSGAVSCGGLSADVVSDLTFEVLAGQVTEVGVALYSREKQTFELLARSIDETGAVQQMPLGSNPSLTLVGADGQAAAELDAADGFVSVEALSGRYTLVMSDREAEKLGVCPVSAEFELPSAEGVISFASDRTRIVIAAVDEDGMPVSGASYSVEDSTGKRFTAVCDEDGLAVSPLLAPGEVHIETAIAPDGHDVLMDVVAAQAVAGEAAYVEMVHQRYGTAELSVRMQSLDEQGGVVHMPFPGVEVHLYEMTSDGYEMKATGDVLVSDEDGRARISLRPGEYVAKIDAKEMETGIGVPQALRFSMHNGAEVYGELICLDELGGVRVRLTGGELDAASLAQVRFELHAQDGTILPLAMQEGAFFAGGLKAGHYVLRQTQMPQGYTLAAERTVYVTGGEAAEMDVPLEEYAVLRVAKTGLTFDDALKTYVVPLPGEYGVFTLEDGEMKPYPSASRQMTVWSHVTPEQVAMGRAASVKLPAAIDGTTYYLREIGAAQGFAADETHYEITLRAGEDQTLHTAVSSDRGFFTFDMKDGADGSRISGGRYALIDMNSAETVLEFELGEESYRNAMAIPVGSYVLRQLEAAEGYAMSGTPETVLTVQPYLTAGGMVTDVAMQSVRIPTDPGANLIEDVYTASEQGLTLLTVDLGALREGETLSAPQVTIENGAAGAERSDIVSVVLSGVTDAQGSAYRARVEYCLDGGGWQPSDARITDILTGPAAVSLDDVQDDISAVRITYIHADTGREEAMSGFDPGTVTLNVEASAEGELNMQAHASFDGVFVYRSRYDARPEHFVRHASADLSYTIEASGLFDTVCAGRDGQISGTVFFDEDADGVLDAEETGRYAGMTVQLLTKGGDIVDTCRTDSEGRYMFGALSGGAYQVQFDAGESVIFSSGEMYSEHVISGVTDTRYGTSSLLVIDGDHTDYLVHAGSIYAAQMGGAIREATADGMQSGLGGLNVELRGVYDDEDDEPKVVMTDDQGMFRFSGLLAGEYNIRISLPEGYLFAGAQDGVIEERVTLRQGEDAWLGDENGFIGQRASSILGSVLVDDDGDGVIPQNASGLAGVHVALLSAEDGYTAQVAETVTDDQGAYVFENLFAGEYSVLFSLNGEWAFTRYGEDSSVYGAVSQSGSTQVFSLIPGEEKAQINAGVTIPAQLSVAVFKDTQYDGQKGVYEEMLPDVSVSLIRLENGEDAEEISYRTDVDGQVTFSGVSPGEYVIAYQMPGQWRATKRIDSETTNYPVSFVPQSSLSSGRSEPFVLSMGQSGTRLYIGAMLSGSIAGVVYYDNNADAEFGADETVCTDVRIELLNGEGAVLAETKPDTDGSYAFEGLAPGRYSVRFTAEEGCGFSGTARTAVRGCVQQSDTNVSTTRVITITNGEGKDSADAGVVRLGSIRGLVWEDQDGDRLPGEGESGLAGLTVNLMNGAGRNILSSTTTDAQGGFVLDNLSPGTYKLRIDGPAGYVFSGELAGSALPLESQRDAHGYSAEFTLLGGAHVQDLGFGLLTQGVISGMVWEDPDYDGIMEDGEAGLRGATVTLLHENGEEAAKVQTIRSGEFTFEKLMPGAYTLRIDLAEGYVFTADGADSAAGHDAGTTAYVDAGTLEMGGAISGIRIGALKPAVVGGTIWMDSDDDGRRQQGDAGLSGLHVTLEMTGGADAGKCMETTTDANGVYAFECVMPGTATIHYALEDGQAFARNASGSKRVSNVPMADAVHAQTAEFAVGSGETCTDIDVGVVGVGTISGIVWEDRAYDGRMDAEENGVAGVTLTLVDAVSGKPISSAVTDEAGAYQIGFVRAGEYTLRAELPDHMIFTRSGDSAIVQTDASLASTAAFKLAMGEGRENLNIGAMIPASLSGSVLLDANENGAADGGETGLAGILVTAMQGGTAAASVYTDENGAYAFSTLRPGTYRLRFTLDHGKLFSMGSALKMIHADALEGETGEYTLEIAQTQTVDPVMAVLASTVSGRAWLDEDVSGRQDQQEAPMTGVTVELLDSDGNVMLTAEVDGSGEYAFGQLRSGTYSIRFTIPQGVLFTDMTGEEGGSCVPVVPGNVGATELFDLAMGQQMAAMNVGGILPGEIGDTVWFDRDGNGLQDYKEPMLSGVSLTLLRVLDDGSFEETMTVESDQYGYYRFESLRPETYVVRLNAQEGDSLTGHFGAPMGEIDSDLDPDTGMSEPISLKSGQTLLNVDIGLTEHAEY